MEGKVVVFIRTSSVARAPVYAHLHSLGLILVVVHPVPPASAFDGCFHHWIPCETCDVEMLHSTLYTYLEEHQLEPHAIISFDEYGVYPAALLAERAHLRSIPFHSNIIQITNIKSLFRQFCKDHHIASPSMQILPRPRYLQLLMDLYLAKHIRSKEEIEVKEHEQKEKEEEEEQEQQQQQEQQQEELVEENSTTNGTPVSLREEFRRHVSEAMNGLEFPIVLKPSPGAGSLLARLCNSIDEVCAHALKAWHILEQHPDVKHFATLHNKWNNTHTHHRSSNMPIEGTPEHEDILFSKIDIDKNFLATLDTHRVHEFCSKYTSNLSTLQPVELLMEEYIDGQEVDMDCAIERGKIMFCSISDNFETKPPHFVEEGGLCPSSLPQDTQEALWKLLQSYVDVFKTQIHGVLHFEAKYSFRRKAAYVIEVNCRMGSAETNMMIQTAFRKVQLGESLVRCALGLPLLPQFAMHYPEYVRLNNEEQQTHSNDCHKLDISAELPDNVINYNKIGGVERGLYPPMAVAASVNLYPTCRGKLRRVQIPENDPDLIAFSVSAQPGQRVAPPPEHDSFLLCWMVARGSGVRNAIDNIHRLTSTFVQEIDSSE